MQHQVLIRRRRLSSFDGGTSESSGRTPPTATCPSTTTRQEHNLSCTYSSLLDHVPHEMSGRGRRGHDYRDADGDGRPLHDAQALQVPAAAQGTARSAAAADAGQRHAQQRKFTATDKRLPSFTASSGGDGTADVIRGAEAKLEAHRGHASSADESDARRRAPAREGTESGAARAPEASPSTQAPTGSTAGTQDVELELVSTGGPDADSADVVQRSNGKPKTLDTASGEQACAETSASNERLRLSGTVCEVNSPVWMFFKAWAKAQRALSASADVHRRSGMLEEARMQERLRRQGAQRSGAHAVFYFMLQMKPMAKLPTGESELSSKQYPCNELKDQWIASLQQTMAELEAKWLVRCVAGCRGRVGFARHS